MRINREVVSTVVGLGAPLGVLIGGMTYFHNQKINTIKEEVKSYNISAKEYEAIKNNINRNSFSPAQHTLGWEKALDSLKTDAAKKAYTEGSQIVNDSIKAASKIKK